MSAIESDDPEVLRAEIRRLQELVGPSEQSYADLRADLLAARDVAIGAKAAEGVQRAQLVEAHRHIARTRYLNVIINRVVNPTRPITSRLQKLARRLTR